MKKENQNSSDKDDIFCNGSSTTESVIICMDYVTVSTVICVNITNFNSFLWALGGEIFIKCLKFGKIFQAKQIFQTKQMNSDIFSLPPTSKRACIKTFI